MNYATIEQIEAGFRSLSEDEKAVCEQLLIESAVIIDSYNVNAADDAKAVVSCRMIRRAIGSEGAAVNFPIGTTQGSVAALGYSASWTNSNGSSGELYLSKIEKKLLGVGNSIGSRSPIEDI